MVIDFTHTSPLLYLDISITDDHNRMLSIMGLWRLANNRN